MEVVSTLSLNMFQQTGQLQRKGRSGGWNWKSQFNLTMFEVPSSPMIVETVVPYKVFIHSCTHHQVMFTQHSVSGGGE